MALALSSSPRVGMRVEVVGKRIGTVKYVGMTAFAAGTWVGVALDEPKGKNDGTVQGKKYFECLPNYAIFVRQTKLMELKSDSNVEEPSQSLKRITSPSSAPKTVGLRKSVSESQTSQIPGKRNKTNGGSTYSFEKVKEVRKNDNGNNLIEHSGVYSYHDDDCRCSEGDFFCNRGGQIWSCCGQTEKYSKCKNKFHQYCS